METCGVLQSRPTFAVDPRDAALQPPAQEPQFGPVGEDDDGPDGDGDATKGDDGTGGGDNSYVAPAASGGGDDSGYGYSGDSADGGT